MGKQSREKWLRRLDSGISVRQPEIQSGLRNPWWPWIATFVLTGAGIAVSNGPWEISGALFGIGVPFIVGGSIAFYRSSSRYFVKSFAICLATLLVAATLWIANRVIRIPIDLSGRTGDTLTVDLRNVVKKPLSISIHCPPSNEDACAFAEQFIPIFQRAGWEVDGPRIDRVSLGRHGKEILLADYGPPLVNPQNPDQGVWTEVLPWRISEEAALQKIGILAHHVNDETLPKTKTRIYFGTVPTKTLMFVIKGWVSSSIAL